MLTRKIDPSDCGFVVTGWQIYKTHVYRIMPTVDTHTLLSGDSCCTTHHPAASLWEDDDDDENDDDLKGMTGGERLLCQGTEPLLLFNCSSQTLNREAGGGNLDG